jgi:NAD(P)-dependent dehydrogenase (short-subunit alcohol dehydrogenase family)
MGQQAIVVKADVSEEGDVIRLFTKTEERLGDIQSLINNTGILFTQSPLVDMSAVRISKVFDTNVLGYFLCCREAIKRMTRRGVAAAIYWLASEEPSYTTGSFTEVAGAVKHVPIRDFTGIYRCSTTDEYLPRAL